MSAQIQVPISSLTLKNVGNADGNENGVAIKDVVMQVITALAAKGGDAAKLPAQLQAFLSSNLGNISQQLGGDFNKQFKNVAGSLGNIGNAAGNTAGNATKGVGSALNGLLGGGKKQGQ